MAREATPTWFFALVVVRLGHRFLLVHEKKHGQHWYLPAGRVEPGETCVQAAVRETREEAGIEVEPEGIVRIEHTPSPGGSRVRVVFVARPIDDTPPKTVPDDETLGAAWVSLDEMNNYSLRGSEVRELFEYIARGGAIAPLSFLTLEGAPYR